MKIFDDERPNRIITCVNSQELEKELELIHEHYFNLDLFVNYEIVLYNGFKILTTDDILVLSNNRIFIDCPVIIFNSAEFECLELTIHFNEIKHINISI